MEEIHLSREAPEAVEGYMVMAGPVPAQWVSLFGRSSTTIPEKAVIKDTIKAPSGKVMGEHESEIDLSVNKRRRLVRTVPVPPSREEGIFIFETRVKEKERWKKVSIIPLEIIFEEKKAE